MPTEPEKKLDLTSLDRAVNSLERVVGVSTDRSRMAPLDADQKEAIRAGVIQSFEFTYEQCWKLLKRQLEQMSPSPEEVDRFSFRDLIRVGAEKGFIDDPTRWFEYRGQRNITSHTYDEEKAEAVYQTAIRFVEDARYLLERLKQVNHED